MVKFTFFVHSFFPQNILFAFLFSIIPFIPLPSHEQVPCVNNPLHTSLNAFVSNVTCHGFNNGWATALISNGAPPFIFSWNTFPVQTTQTASNLAPGNYICTVTDSNGCTSTLPVTIDEPPPLRLSINLFPPSSVDACDGKAIVLPAGGNENYSFLWSPGNISSAAAENLCPGNYSITVIDLYGCTAVGTIEVIQPDIKR